VLAAALVLTSLGSAVAQPAACKRDYDKFCKGTLPDGSRMLACLSKQRAQLSDACKKVIDAQQK
jgi:hypothetical protein